MSGDTRKADAQGLDGQLQAPSNAPTDQLADPPKLPSSSTSSSTKASPKSPKQPPKSPKLPNSQPQHHHYASQGKPASPVTSGANRQPNQAHGGGFKMLGHRFSFSKHTLPSKPETHSNLSQSLRENPALASSHKISVLASQNARQKPQRLAGAGAAGAGGVSPGLAPGSISQSPMSLRINTEAAATSSSDEYDPEDVVSSDSSSDDESKLRREEDVKDYRAGGYHPTYVGERYGRSQEYLIVRKLGWGHFSTVWLAWDSLRCRHVAIKIVRSSKNYTEAAEDEIRILEKVNSGPATHPGKHHVVELLDHFVLKGPNGSHVCMVFEVLGENMLGLLQRYKKFQKEKTKEIEQSTAGPATNGNAHGAANGASNGAATTDGSANTPGSNYLSESNSVEFHLTALNDLTILRESYGGLPLTLVKQISKQILLALDYLHRECGIIHTDLKPENVLVEIHDVEKLVRTLELERRHRKSLRGGKTSPNVKRGHRNIAQRSVSGPTKVDIPRRRTPVRPSKPLTTPVETSSSVDNFFRSFSIGRPRSHTASSFPVDPMLSPGGRFSGTPVIPRPGSAFEEVDEENESDNEEDELAEQSHAIDELIAEEDEDEEFVDATEIPTPPSSTRTPPDVNISLAVSVDANSSPSTAPAINTATPNNNTSVHANHTLPTATPHNYYGTPHRNGSTLRRGSTFSLASSNSVLHDLDSVISVKIADLGNACWYDLHYTNDIETRQYRAPEIILGGRWGCSTDNWSCACLIFELITGDYLFDPKSGSTYDKNDDHLAQIIELLQTWPSREYLKKCKYAREYFDKSMQALLNISKLKVWTMPEVLQEEYHIEKPLADEISNFLLSMLGFEPNTRVDAGSMSNHSWVQDCLEESIDRPFGLKGTDIKGYSSEWHHESDA